MSKVKCRYCGKDIDKETAYSVKKGQYYCMIVDENGRLKKQYVVTGKTLYGSAIEIKSGLTEDDYIAFPYGKDVVEGATVIEAMEY